MKKLLSLALVLVIVLSAFTLVSCKDKNGEESGESSAPTVATTPYDGGFFTVNIPNTLVLASETGDENQSMRMYVNMQTGESLTISSAKGEVSEEKSEWTAPTAQDIANSYKGDGTYEVSEVDVEVISDNYVKYSLTITRVMDNKKFYVSAFAFASGPDANNIIYSVSIMLMEIDAARPMANALFPTVK